MRMSRFVLAAAAAALVPASAFAQTEGDIKNLIAYTVLTNTPIGALPPSAHGVDAVKTKATFDLRYGRISYDGDVTQNAFAIGGSMALAGGRIGAQLGQVSCDGCEATNMIGVDYEYSLVNGKQGKNAWAVGVQPSFGYGTSSEEIAGEDVSISGMSLSVGVPLSLSGGKAWRYTGFVTPGFGFGRMSSEGESESGNRPMVGAGARVRNTSMGLGFLVGVQKVFIENGKTQLGLGMSWTPSGR